MRSTVFLLLLATLPLAAQGAVLKDTSCTACHSDADLFDEQARQIVADYGSDVHATIGLSCHDCHGGNPAMRLADDVGAMDEDFAPNPYRGAPGRADIPSYCGDCHSDPGYMRRFKPDARVDQEREYWTSQHGIALAAGDDRVATCIDCHGVHGIRRTSNPDSSVYPARVAETCSSCHSDSARMAGMPEGSPSGGSSMARAVRSNASRIACSSGTPSTGSPSRSP